MIGIGDYSFDGQFFARWDGAPFLAEDRRALQSMIIDRAFNMPRWQGEPGRLGPLSVGHHSIMVGGLAAFLAVREGKERHTVEECLRYGVAHDFGEVLGLGDIAAPWLRLHPEIAQLTRQHQRAAEELFGLEPATEVVARLVETADRLAVIFERRFYFADYSGRCESPEVVSLFEELVRERPLMPALRPVNVERAGVRARRSSLHGRRANARCPRVIARLLVHSAPMCRPAITSASSGFRAVNEQETRAGGAVDRCCRVVQRFATPATSLQVPRGRRRRAL